MISLSKNDVPGSSRCCLSRPYIIKALAKLISHDDYYSMTFNQCLKFIMIESNGLVNPHVVIDELIILFKERGFDVKL